MDQQIHNRIPLPQGAGYAVVVGLGFVFAIGMMSTTFALRRYNKEIMTSEEFSTAGRSVKTGLISAAVVSSWTWAATLLTSTTVCFNNGVAGPFFYAAGATCQIILFAFISIKAKQIAPAAHTYLEIIKTRYGPVTHSVYLFFGIATNVLVTAMLLSGGSAVVSDLTGMHPVAACLLLPLGVVIYTLFGGIKSTILTDYAHTCVLLIIILIFSFSAFATNPALGSPGAVWDKLTELAKTDPIAGNSEGSYLTMKSRGGGIFFVINIVGNFGTVFLDNGYFNKAFASSPAATLPGYVLGGLAWFAIPMLTATTMGLAGLALQDDPSWPTYPYRLTAQQISSGLVLPNTAVALLGKGGAVCALLMVFMACTSAMSAELIAVSTVVSYDVYRTYINPAATGKSIIFVSHAAVIVFAYVMAGFSIGLYYAGISMGYLYELMGVIISGAVLPSVLSLLSSKQNWAAATFSPILALIFSVMSWLVCTKSKFGTVNVTTTFEDDAMLTGNVVALLSPMIFIPVLTYVFKPQNYDFSIMSKQITLVDEAEEIIEATESRKFSLSDPERLSPLKSQVSEVAHEIAIVNKIKFDGEQAKLKDAARKAALICVTLTVCLLVLWPMPMYGTGYVFSKRFFIGWVVVLFIWIWFTVFMVMIYPLYEGREGIYTTFRGIYWDLSGQTYKLREWQNANPEKLHVVQSQVSAELINGVEELPNISEALEDKK